VEVATAEGISITSLQTTTTTTPALTSLTMVMISQMINEKGSTTMRHLTASQKIAILENRVAHLEKQAMLEGLKAKIADAMSPFERLVPHTKKIIKDTRKSPKQIAQEYMKVRKDPNFKKAMKQLQREAGSSPVKQVSYIIDAYKSGELESTPRTASMTRRGSFVHDIHAMMFMVELAGAILAAICILDVGYEWVVSKIKGLFKRGSVNKEAAGEFILVLLSFITSFYLGSSLGNKHYERDKKKIEEKRRQKIEEREEELHVILKTLFEPFFKDVDFSDVSMQNNLNDLVLRFSGYVFLGSEEVEIKAKVFKDDNKVGVSVSGEQAYYGRMDPLLLNSRNRELFRFTLKQLGII